MSQGCSYRLATPAGGGGAIAIIELIGDDVERILKAITRIEREWPIGVLRLANLGGVDDGIAVRVGDTAAQLMPHGGPRVVQLLRVRLNELGAEPLRVILPREAYPEAANEDEALMLEALARAASPAAVDLLLDQPRRWSDWRERPPVERESIERIRERSVLLNRFLEPPIVVVTGPPNIGKSTLLNALAGRPISIAADQPGVTRDYVGALIDLRGLVVQWYDTPGRDSNNPDLDLIEDAAIRISESLIASADLIIAATDDPYVASIESPRTSAELQILLKADKYEGATAPAGVDLTVSAFIGAGLSEFVDLVRERLAPSVAHRHPGPWLFDERLIGEM